MTTSLETSSPQRCCCRRRSLRWQPKARRFAGPRIGPVPVEFILFALVLAGVAMLHLHALKIALGGAVTIALYKLLFSPFKTGAGLGGLVCTWATSG